VSAPATIAAQQTSNRINPPGKLPSIGSIQLNQTLPANGAAGYSITIPCLGSSFYVSAISPTSLAVQVQPTGGDLGTYELGQGQDYNREGGFSSITVTNPNSVPITFTLVIGFPDFIDKRLVIIGGTTINIEDSPTTPVGTALGAMLAGASTAFPGVSVAGVVAAGKIRRQIIVTNNDSALVVAVLDSAGVRIGAVYPQRAWALATSGSVTVKNQNGSALTGNVDVGETFYN
jgi:hypothetical protein